MACSKENGVNVLSFMTLESLKHKNNFCLIDLGIQQLLKMFIAKSFCCRYFFTPFWLKTLEYGDFEHFCVDVLSRRTTKYGKLRLF